MFWLPSCRRQEQVEPCQGLLHTSSKDEKNTKLVPQLGGRGGDAHLRPAAGVQVNACPFCSSAALCLCALLLPSDSISALPSAHLAAQRGPEQAQVVLHGATTFWSRRGWRSGHAGQRRACTWCGSIVAGRHQLQHTSAVCNQAHIGGTRTGRSQRSTLRGTFQECLRPSCFVVLLVYALAAYNFPYRSGTSQECLRSSCFVVLRGPACAGDPLVQYVVLRRDLWADLGWPLGSVVAQACHAATAALWLSREEPATSSYCAADNIDHMHKVPVALHRPCSNSCFSTSCLNGIAAVLWRDVCIYICPQVAFSSTCACALSFTGFLWQSQCPACALAGGA